jgi:hypothetical protein
MNSTLSQQRGWYHEAERLSGLEIESKPPGHCDAAIDILNAVTDRHLTSVISPMRISLAGNCLLQFGVWLTRLPYCSRPEPIRCHACPRKPSCGPDRHRGFFWINLELFCKVSDGAIIIALEPVRASAAAISKGILWIDV